MQTYGLRQQAVLAWPCMMTLLLIALLSTLFTSSSRLYVQDMHSLTKSLERLELQVQRTW